MRGATIRYAEIDGIAVCILADGRWCEREAGHDGAHVLASMVPRADWDAAKRGHEPAAPPQPRSPEHRPDGPDELHRLVDELQDGRDEHDDLEVTVRVGRRLRRHGGSSVGALGRSSACPVPMRCDLGAARPPDG